MATEALRKLFTVRIGLFMLMIAVWSINAPAQEYSYQARVEGMVCAFCAYSVNKKVSALPGVAAESVNVDLKKGTVVFRSTRPVSEKVLEPIFSESGFIVSGLRETAIPLVIDQRPSTLALDLKIDGLDTAELESLLEAVGNLAASRPSRIVINAPSASESSLLKPVLMGRQQVMKVRYIPADNEMIRLQLYLMPE